MFNLGRFCIRNIQAIYFINGCSYRRILYSTSSSSTEQALQSLLSDYLGFSNNKPPSSSSNKLSKYLHLQTSKKVSHSDFAKNVISVVELFKKLGFELSQIRTVIFYKPALLSAKVDKTLNPKIKLLQDLGFSRSDLVDAILANPTLLCRQLGPGLNALRSVLGNDTDVVKIVKRSNWFCFESAAKYLIPNVELLLNYGIPRDKIQNFMLQQPRIFVRETDILRDMLIRVEHEFGIPRESASFLRGLYLTCFKEESIEKKYDVFKSFGWTQSDILTLIRKNPYSLGLSESLIEKKLEFLVKELRLEPAYLALNSILMTYSLKKRLLPRHRMLCFLKEKGFLIRDYRFLNVACISESLFVKKFVEPYKDVAPDIHQVYLSIQDPIY